MNAPSETITIRRPRNDDAAAMVAIMGDPQVLPSLLQLPDATEAEWRKQASLALYCKFSFFSEGTHRVYVMGGGVFVDAVCMARLQPKPTELVS